MAAPRRTSEGARRRLPSPVASAGQIWYCRVSWWGRWERRSEPTSVFSPPPGCGSPPERPPIFLDSVRCRTDKERFPFKTTDALAEEQP